MFYLCIKGNVSVHEFTYLHGNIQGNRLEKTLPHGAKRDDFKRRASDNKKVTAIEVMSKNVFSVKNDDLLPKIKDFMKSNEIRHVPVIEKNRLQGMISDRDLLRLDQSAGFNFLKSHEIMSDIVMCAHEETTIEAIAKVLVTEKISALPILNNKHSVVGIVSYLDILKYVVKEDCL